MFVIEVLGTALELFPKGTPTRYLKMADIEAKRGRGAVEFTTDIDEALTFTSSAEAFDLYMRRSITFPSRGDGEPNRPLTAYTVEVRKK